MKIHSDVLTSAAIHAAMREVGYNRIADGLESLTPGTMVDRCDAAGSRQREHGFIVSLSHDGTRSRHRRNPGTSQDRSVMYDEFAAPYDDWGWWLARLYELDPDMIAGQYENAAHFHRVTRARYSEWPDAPFIPPRPERVSYA
jgi:hypothetical protein